MKTNDKVKAIDVKRQFGTMVFLGVYDWTDFKTKEVKGVNIIFSSEEYGGREKIIRIKDARKEMFKDFEMAEPISFENVTATDWAMKSGKTGTTFYAEKLIALKKAK